MIFSSHSNAKQAVEKLNIIVKILVEFSESHRLTINTDKIEFIIFLQIKQFIKIGLLVKN